jgi:hypothetical protein
MQQQGMLARIFAVAAMKGGAPCQRSCRMVPVDPIATALPAVPDINSFGASM